MEELIEKAKDGDKEAFTILLSYHIIRHFAQYQCKWEV